MRYDDVIKAARDQDAGPNPGPEFSTLLTAAAAGNAAAGKSLGTWLLAALGGITLIGGATFLFMGGEEEPAPAEPVAVVAPVEPATREPEVAPPPEPAPAPAPAPVVAPPEEEPEAQKPAPKLKTTRPQNADDPEALYRSAEDHMAAGELGVARGELRRLVRKFPDYKRHSTAMLDLAKLENRMGKSQAAACSYRAFMGKYPRDPMSSDAKTALGKLEKDAKVDVTRCK